MHGATIKVTLRIFKIQSYTTQLLLCGLERCNYVLQDWISYTFIDYSVTGMRYLTFIRTTRVSTHKVKNLGRKLYSCNSNIYFNQKCSSCYIISNSYKKPNEMHYFLTLFVKELYMFWDRFTVHHQVSQHCIHSNWYLLY
jgi:hypothetical protein